MTKEEFNNLKFGDKVKNTLDDFNLTSVFICKEKGQCMYYPKNEEELNNWYVRLWKKDTVGQQSEAIEEKHFIENYQLLVTYMSNHLIFNPPCQTQTNI